MGSVSGIGGAGESQPQSETKQKAELQALWNAFQKLMEEAQKNGGVVPLNDYNNLMDKLKDITADPMMPHDVGAEAAKLLQMMRDSSVTEKGGVKVDMRDLDYMQGEIPSMYEQLPGA